MDLVFAYFATNRQLRRYIFQGRINLVMPAIQLARLKIQSAELVSHFYDPAAFVRGLHDLLDFYADRTRKPGQAGEPPPLIKPYNVPPPVLRQVKTDLNPYVATDKDSALALCDTLWGEPYLECRLLAIELLGLIPPDPPDEVLERVNAWATPKIEDRLLNALVNKGLIEVSKRYPELFLSQVDEWLTSEEDLARRMGLKAISMMLEDRDFENLPKIFRLLAPLIRSSPSQLRPDLLDVIQSLAKRSPNETAFFLRQNLSVLEDNSGTAWLIRNSARYFPAEIQISLKNALREGI
jgi:hypothetical protein